MHTWKSRTAPLVAALITVLAAGCGSAASLAARAAPEEPDITVAALMALPGFPAGPVNDTQIQRIATAMLTFGMLGQQYASEVQHGTLVESMIGPG